MTPSDEIKFIDYLYTIDNIYIVQHKTYLKKQYKEITSARDYFNEIKSPINNSYSAWFIGYKTNTTDKILFLEYTLDKFGIDHPANSFIGYIRSYEQQNRLSMGELIHSKIIIGFDNKLYLHDNNINNIYTALTKWIKKNSVRATYDGDKLIPNTFILPDALEFYRGGGNLGSWNYIQIGFENESYKPIGDEVTKDDTIQERLHKRK
jgi:hypothetical protein